MNCHASCPEWAEVLKQRKQEQMKIYRTPKRNDVVLLTAARARAYRNWLAR